MRLGVNIDHVATVRQARRTFEPSPVFAALIAQQAGADQITLHLREDRRHIQDRDLELIKELVSIPLNLEMAPVEEMQSKALKVKPDRVTLVPERREEITTEGGLDVTGMRGYLAEFIRPLSEVGIEVSLFVEAEEELKRIEAAARLARDLGLRVYAGHGLTYHNVRNILKLSDVIEELNIGHSIVANAVILGFERAVREMISILRGG